MVIDLPEELAAALQRQASAHGVSAAIYICEVLERDLAVQSGEGPAVMGSELIRAMHASPFKEVRLDSGAEQMPVRDVVL